MKHTHIIARQFPTGQLTKISCQNGVISSLEPAVDSKTNLWIAPSLFDVQVNGYGGIDYQQDSLKADDLSYSVTQMHFSGCSQILLTLITRKWPELMAQLRRMKKLRDSSPLLQAAIPGWHIEGPFMSSQPGFHGAHNPELMIDPTPEKIRELREITQNDPVMLTLAPERENALSCVKLATSLGIRVSLGHTNASAEQIRQAVANGATGVTHLGNGIPQTLDRHDNILWRVFDTPGLTPGIIPDKLHVSPTLFRIMHRQLPKENIYYTTDAMAAAGAPPGQYTIGAVKLEVGEDQVVRQPGKTNFAGSALKPMDGIQRAAEMLNCSWRDVWNHNSSVPRKMMGIQHELSVGAPAHFCVLETDGDRITGGQTFVAGTPFDLKL